MADEMGGPGRTLQSEVDANFESANGSRRDLKLPQRTHTVASMSHGNLVHSHCLSTTGFNAIASGPVPTGNFQPLLILWAHLQNFVLLHLCFVAIGNHQLNMISPPSPHQLLAGVARPAPFP